MEKTVKIDQATRLRGEISGITALVLVEYSGLTVASADDIRRRFRAGGCRYRVYKNSTIHYAIAGTRHEPLTPYLRGVSGLAYHADDPGAPARIARDFAKENDKFRVKAAVIDGQALDADGTLRLADLPGPRELKAQFLSLLNQPATTLVQVLAAPMRDFLNVLNAKKDKDAA